MSSTAASVPRLSSLLAAAMAVLALGPGAMRVMADRDVTVKDGDTLTAIAVAYYGDAGLAQQIASYNHLTDPDHLQPGLVLKLPDLPAQPAVAGIAAGALGALAARTQVTPAAPRAGPVIQTGLATWYGPGFDGNLTKCGQIFSEDDLTASSNDLPCGTVIKVTNVDNGRSVVVTVDDTGDFHHPTILDLSAAAFRAIASPDDGVIDVSVARVQ